MARDSGTSGQKILIIGCGGFIGSHLVEYLLRDTSFSVAGIDISDRKIGHLLNNDAFSFHKIDIKEISSVLPLVSRCDTVVLLAGLCNPSLYNTVPAEVIEA